MEALLAEVTALRAKVALLEAERLQSSSIDSEASGSKQQPSSSGELCCSLTPPDILRYSRQLLVPAFGAPGQEALRGISALIIGAGGLGCPAATYLCGAGIGLLGIVDSDVVDVNNLHRQVAHCEALVGVPKALSLAAAVRALNSGVAVEPHVTKLTAANGMQLVSAYDVILDCTDNPATRYLINDACVLAGKPLVSGAALGTDGQLSVYNHDGGPCYRCLHPSPPAFVASCADAGVLGPITGIIGCLQALEVMKIAPAILTAKKQAASHAIIRSDSSPHTQMGDNLGGRLLVFDGCDTRFKVVKLRPRSPGCAVCGDRPSITTLGDSEAWSASHGLVPMEVTRRPAPSIDAAPANAAACACDSASSASLSASTPTVPSISVQQLAALRSDDKAQPLTILDCRSATQYDICALKGSINIPLARLQYDTDTALRLLTEHSSRFAASAADNSSTAAQGPDASPASPGTADRAIYVLCRRGVDSVTATRLLRSRGLAAFNVTGGLTEWAKEVDTSFPRY